MPGYLRLPTDADRPPIVLMIGGADTNKEELHHWSTCSSRCGLAVLAFDGPGQGELSARYQRLTMRFETYHRAVATAISYVQGRSEVDGDRLGIFGNSLGGYLALDAAVRDHRVGAVICNGGFYDAQSLDEWPEPVVKAFSELPRHIRAAGGAGAHP